MHRLPHRKAKANHGQPLPSTSPSAAVGVPPPPATSYPRLVLLGSLACSLAIAVGLVLSRNRRSRERARKEAFERLRRQAENPLQGCSLCTACGWLGRAASRVIQAGGSSGCSLAFALLLGGGLILVGLPLLLFEGLGCLPIFLGIVVIATALIVSSVTSSHRSMAVSQLAATPHQCPQCRNHSLIPAASPNGQSLIAATPHFQAAAQAEVQRVRMLAGARLMEGAAPALGPCAEEAPGEAGT